jgi:hypothetical protein
MLRKPASRAGNRCDPESRLLLTICFSMGRIITAPRPIPVAVGAES